MRGHTIKSINKYKKLDEHSTKDTFDLNYIDNNIVISYQNIEKINVLLNKMYDQKQDITLYKESGTIFIKLRELDINKYYEQNYTSTLNNNISRSIKLLEISNNLSIVLNQDKIRLYANDYFNILNNTLVFDKDHYILDDKNIEIIYQEIKKYNELISITNCQISREITNFNIFDIKEVLNKDSIIIIFNNNFTNKLIIKNKKNISFTVNNIESFINIFLPEILKNYASIHYKIDKESIDMQFNRCFCNINDNLYILNYKEEICTANISFLRELCKENGYRINISKNYLETFDESQDFNKNIKPKYSYGYINILLISFIISILTIIICLMKY